MALTLAAVEAARARKAERERDELRQEQRDAERIRVAALVSSWVEVHYIPAEDGTHYQQRASVFVANESDEPVFNVHVRIGAGEPPIQIGPLAVPVPIRVLPPRRSRSWDISLGLMAWAHAEGPMPADPVARIDFSDSRGIRWHKDFNGTLTESAGSSTPLFDHDEEVGVAQLGDLSHMFNPMVTALAFHELVTADENTDELDEIRSLLDENANGWRNFDQDQLSAIRTRLSGFGLATHVWYPAPYVAYVRLVHDEDAQKHVDEAGFIGVRSLTLTLTFVPGRGWRIFSVGGATAPDWVEFPPGSLTRKPRE